MYRKVNGGTRFNAGDSVYETPYSVLYASKLGKSDIMADGPSDIWKWMVEKRFAKMEERLNRSAKTTGSAS